MATTSAPIETKQAFRHLTKRVTLDKDTVTYRMLSREMGITVQAAKQFLKAYLQDPSAKERGVSATYVLTGTLKQPQANGHSASSNGSSKHTTDADGMDIDAVEPTSQVGSSSMHSTRLHNVQTRTVLIVPQAQLQDHLTKFVHEPSQHVYAASPGVLVDLSALASSALFALPESTLKRWKPRPASGYGAIEHPDGVKKRKSTAKAGAVASGSGKAAAAAAAVPAAAAEATKKLTNASKSNATTAKPDTKGKGKDKDSAKPTARPIGQLGGLFADRNSSSKSSTSNVPSKRKASEPAAVTTKPKAATAAPKRAGKSNGIFGDEELDSDQDFGDDDMDAWDEEAMKEAEEEAAQKLADKKNGQASRSNSVESSKVKRSESMVLDDDDEEDAKPKPTPKEGPAAKPAQAKPGPAKSGVPSSKPAAKAGNLMSFFGKK
ncbi:hypothetical protein ACM66B_004031 [Microbotryomycetes sp. NB124-2]